MTDQHTDSTPDEGAAGATADPSLPALTRRDLLAGAVGTLGGAMLAGLPVALGAQQADATARPVVPDDATKLQGAPTSPLGERSPFETPKRGPTGATTGSSLTPLQDLTGNLTPSDLHFERHHAGIPALDPERHTLTIHGLVERPLTFSLADLKRFPQVVRTHFIECSGNGRAAFRAPKPEMTAQQVSGMISTTEFTGVTLATLFRECGVKPEAKWFLAEGGDACVMTRSVPIEKAWDDALIVWAQNGEPLRPAQGYPLRLVLPGWEGNINIKWVRRLELGTLPWMTRWETSKYTDPLPNKTARRFTFECDVKSIITSPTVSDVVSSRGWHSVSGLAWSGRGRVRRVEVSVDGGKNWADAQLLGEPQSKSTIRFQHMWEFTGRESVLLSRATDDAGYTQPTRQQIIDARGLGTDYHFNPVLGWKVAADGSVTFHGET